MSGSWKKWSITKTVSKPLCSPVAATAAMRSKSSSGATPGQVKLGIWSPMGAGRVIVEYRSSKSSMIGERRLPGGLRHGTRVDPVLTSAGYLLLKAGTQFHALINDALAEHAGLTGRQFLVLTFAGSDAPLSDSI